MEVPKSKPEFFSSESQSFKNVGFQHANIAIRAVAEDIEVSSENVEHLPGIAEVIKTETNFEAEEQVIAQVANMQNPSKVPKKLEKKPDMTDNKSELDLTF